VAIGLLTGCTQQRPAPMDQSRAPDVIGTVTAIDNSSPDKRVTVEADPGDPTVNGRGTTKVEISNFFRLVDSGKVKTGCLVRIWYDQSLPIIDTYPQVVAAQSIEVVRCP
jgi:hypothetical protein